MMVFVLCLLQWQQQVAYQIEAYLDTAEHALKGVEDFTYYNQSPYTLDTLYFHLYANAYRSENTVFMKEMKKLSDYGLENAVLKEPGYLDIEYVLQHNSDIKFIVQDSLLIIPLVAPLKSADSVKLTIGFYLKIPVQISRLGYQNEHYEMVQWYPKVCVFDKRGWHCEGYHAIGEFYGEYGSFNIELDIPSGYVVAATGKQYSETDEEITGSKDLEPGSRKKVRFFAQQVHDFAWVCDPDFVVEHNEINGIDLYVFYLKKHKKTWAKAMEYAVDAVKRYNKWYGKYPYESLSIVDGYFEGGMEYPNLVIIGGQENRYVRSFEIVIIHEIGHQWFYGILGSNELDEPWLDEGFTTFTELRYLEDKYGKNNSLFKLSFLPDLSRRYYHQLIYYISQTNNAEKCILTPAYDYLDLPFAYLNGAYSKPALFLYNLKGIVGDDVFDRIMQRYYQAFRFKHPTSQDFLKVCQEETELDLEPFFAGFLTTTFFCDWSVKKVQGSTVVLENKGAIFAPVDVLIEGENGVQIFRLQTDKKVFTIEAPATLGRIKRVVIDPDKYSLEPDYWNNYYPRQVKIKALFSLPSLDAYQIIIAPYLWYGTKDGVIPGIYALGGQFLDYDFLKGSQQWIVGCTYGLKSKRFYPQFKYQTPLLFNKDRRLRFYLEGSKPYGLDKAKSGIVLNAGLPFSEGLRLEIKHLMTYSKLYSYEEVDSRDWQTGTNIYLDNNFSVFFHHWKYEGQIAFAPDLSFNDWHYLRTALSAERTFKQPISFKLRLFGGKIFGQAPTQEQFFLSGALRITMLPDLIFGQQGYFSPQEHIHITGDGNMRGYQTRHIKSNKMFCVNLEFPQNSPIRLFTDVGYYQDYAFDLGACLVLGPVSFNLPLYVWGEDEWKIYWSIGF